jgi:hypothetical protein
MMERVATTVSYKSQSMAATLKFIPPGNWGGAEKYEPIRGHFPGARCDALTSKHATTRPLQKKFSGKKILTGENTDPIPAKY